MNPYIGSSFDDFLKEEGILDECTETAINRVIKPILVGFKLENNSGLSDLFNQIDIKSQSFKDGMTALLDAVEEDRKATDPLNLMPLFSVTEWRYKLSDWLMSLSIWIDPE